MLIASQTMTSCCSLLAQTTRGKDRGTRRIEQQRFKQKLHNIIHKAEGRDKFLFLSFLPASSLSLLWCALASDIVIRVGPWLHFHRFETLLSSLRWTKVQKLNQSLQSCSAPVGKVFEQCNRNSNSAGEGRNSVSGGCKNFFPFPMQPPNFLLMRFSKHRKPKRALSCVSKSELFGLYIPSDRVPWKVGIGHRKRQRKT